MSIIGGQMLRAQSIQKEVNNSPTAIKHYTPGIYPNPMMNEAIVTFGEHDDTHGHDFLLFNLIGNEVMRIENIKGSEYAFQREKLQSGVYFYIIVHRENNEQYTGRLIVK